MPIDMVAGDTGTKLVATCKDKLTKAVISLVGATVSLKWSIDGGATQSRAMVITNAAGGVAEYLFVAGELVEGALVGQVKITDQFARVVTQTDPFIKQVGPSL